MATPSTVKSGVQEVREAGLQAVAAGDLQTALGKFRQIDDWYNESSVLALQRRYFEAIEAAERGLKTSEPVKANKRLMEIYWELGDRANAKKYIDAVLAVEPNEPDVRVARGTWLLAGGDQSGWEDIEHRPWARSQREAYDEVPEWNGEDLTDKALLIVYQDGIGDQIMFSRFIDYIAGRYSAERIVVFADPQLARIFHDSYAVEVVGHYSQIGAVDFWIGMSSLGKLKLPIKGEPYLHVPEQRLKRLASSLGRADRLRVGLVWAGQPKHTQDRNRSVKFDFFKPLLDLPGVDFYSLQFGKNNLDHDGKLLELSAYCKDVADTAAAISNLDLVIGVDTGILHIAGALGIPAWVLCFTPVDWRWGLETTQSYWYDSVKIYRNACSATILSALHKYAPEKRSRIEAEPLPLVSESETRYGVMSYFTHDLWCGRALEEYGEWSEGEMELLRAVLDIDGKTKEKVMLEAGANIGAHTIGLSQVCKHVLAFEPQDKVFELLAHNKAKNKSDNVTCIKAALGSKTMMVAYEQASGNTVVNPGAVQMTNKVGAKKIVQMVTIDSLGIKRLDLIKADVEGLEDEVLRGALETIKKFRPVLYLENNHAADRVGLLRLVDSLQYRIYQHEIPLYNPNNYKGDECNVFGQWDSKMILCVPRERFDLRPVTRMLQRIR